MKRKGTGSEHIRLAHYVVSSNYDYPSDLSSKASVFNFLKKKNFDSNIVDAFNLAWNEFAELPYCTIKTKTKKKRLSY